MTFKSTRRVFQLSALGVLMLVGCRGPSKTTRATQERTSPPPPPPPDPSATLRVRSGRVLVNDRRVTRLQSIQSGDRITTRRGGKAIIEFDDGTIIEVFSDLTLESVERTIVVILDRGTIIVKTATNRAAEVIGGLARLLIKSEVVVQRDENEFVATLLSGRMTLLEPEDRRFTRRGERVIVEGRRVTTQTVRSRDLRCLQEDGADCPRTSDPPSRRSEPTEPPRGPD